MQGIDKSKEIIKLLDELRSWELNNLPLVNTSAGYQLIFYFLKTVVIYEEEIRLKNIYYSLPYSEKTLRLLLRELENDGWIEMSKKKMDSRFKDVKIKNKLLTTMNAWLKKINSIFYFTPNNHK